MLCQTPPSTTYETNSGGLANDVRRSNAEEAAVDCDSDIITITAIATTIRMRQKVHQDDELYTASSETISDCLYKQLERAVRVYMNSINTKLFV